MTLDMTTRIEEALVGWFGPRCSDTMEGCPCCDTWAEYDAMVENLAELLWLRYCTKVGAVGAIWSANENKDDWRTKARETLQERHRAAEARKSAAFQKVIRRGEQDPEF